jgi:hypothetical protein
LHDALGHLDRAVLLNLPDNLQHVDRFDVGDWPLAEVWQKIFVQAAAQTRGITFHPAGAIEFEPLVRHNFERATCRKRLLAPFRLAHLGRILTAL